MKAAAEAIGYLVLIWLCFAVPMFVAINGWIWWKDIKRAWARFTALPPCRWLRDRWLWLKWFSHQ